MLEKAFSPDSAEASNEKAGRGAVGAPSLATALVKKGWFAVLKAPTKERTSKHAGGMVCLVPLRLQLSGAIGARVSWGGGGGGRRTTSVFYTHGL